MPPRSPLPKPRVYIPHPQTPPVPRPPAAPYIPRPATPHIPQRQAVERVARQVPVQPLGQQTIPTPKISQQTVMSPRRTPPLQRTVHQGAAPTRRRSGGFNKWLIIAPVLAISVVVMSVCAALTLGVVFIYGSGVLPKVSTAGVALGGLSEAAAADRLRTEWDSIELQDGERTWAVNPVMLGITLDAAATAKQAYEQGRGTGSPIQAILGQVDVPPVISIDIVTAAVTLDEMASTFDIAPVNAGVRLVNGTVEATPPQEGRMLDVVRLIKRLETNVAAEVMDGIIDLPMRVITPTITDSTPLLAQAHALLARPLLINAYDPIDNERYNWSLPPEEWGRWLTTAGTSSGLTLALDTTALRNFLSSRQQSLSGAQYVDISDATNALQTAIANDSNQAQIRIYHDDLNHTVQPGETLITIAWHYGIPYPWIQQANPGIGDNLSVGQNIIIPSADNFLDFPIVPNKRIVVSISQQRVRVYENDQLKWDWVASTGINSSPTWPGVYQIISHEPNAYASNWNLWMPNFLGVYRPVPGQDFVNGFHGFPTRGGSQLLWTNNLGTRVTYGCILLSSENASQLYNWAEEGVVVEIQA
ncbi:MAG: hypothetical protein CL610_28145 [Anaerolineaceae bacterium]|nr:hypothetical protein [Anaerolineaceae bacterium]